MSFRAPHLNVCAACVLRVRERARNNLLAGLGKFSNGTYFPSHFSI